MVTQAMIAHRPRVGRFTAEVWATVIRSPIRPEILARSSLEWQNSSTCRDCQHFCGDGFAQIAG